MSKQVPIPSLATIRKNYPKPTHFNPYSDHLQGYCVGGALCLQLGQHEANFPAYIDVVDALEKMGLGCGDSENFAERILYENDTSHFERAWKILGKALDLARKLRKKKT